MTPLPYRTFVLAVSGVLLAIWTLYFVERRRTPDAKRRVFVTALATICISFALVFWSFDSIIVSHHGSDDTVVVKLFLLNLLALILGAIVSIAVRPRKMSNYCLSAFSLLCIWYWCFLVLHSLKEFLHQGLRS